MSEVAGSANPIGPAIVVIPCFNEAARISLDAVRALAAECRVLLVDDGSTDDTLRVLQHITAEVGGCELLALANNGGKAEAVRQGLLHAIGQNAALVGFTDADFSTPPDEIARLLRNLQANASCDAVIGCRLVRLGAEIQRDPLRHVFGRVFASAASLAIGASVYDSQCGAKWFVASPTFATIIAQPFLSNWAFDVELLARMFQAGLHNVQEEPLRRWADVAGSKVTVRGALQAGTDLIRIGWRHRRR